MLQLDVLVADLDIPGSIKAAGLPVSLENFDPSLHNTNLTWPEPSLIYTANYIATSYSTAFIWLQVKDHLQTN